MTDGFGRYDVYSFTDSLYCYRGTNVLRNRFGLRDGEALRALEADLSLLRQNSLLQHPIQGRFTANHLCRIHRYLLGDLYPFAGHFRREDIWKGYTRFLTHREIPGKLKTLLNQLRQEGYLHSLSRKDFLARSAYYFAELNYIHPFREGNGRATREFMRLLFLENGYLVQWSAVPTEEFLSAMAASVFDSAVLHPILDACLVPLPAQTES